MLTSKERISRILRHKPVDRIGLFEVFWRETARQWAREGHFEKPEMVEDHFGLDLARTCTCITPAAAPLLDLVADPNAGEQVVEETGEWRLVRNSNGALLRWLKDASGACEHVDFLVKDRAGWEEHLRPRLLDKGLYERRINFDLYRRWQRTCEKGKRFHACTVVGAFDLMSPMCGHENLLVGMALDPGWVGEMAEVYTTSVIEMLEILFEREGLPDGLWVFDDLGFRNGPFMSPPMYRELLFPQHKRLFRFAQSRKLPVILHSDGNMQSLIPDLIEAGLDCLQPIETKSGMDLVKLKKSYGEKLAFIGGMDARVLITGDLAAVRAELERKVPPAMAGGGYILQVDHSVPHQVAYETYRYFVDKGLEIGTYE